MKSFILASQSPVRKKILSDLGYTFDCIPSFTDEYFTDDSIEKNAMRLALEKATSVQSRYPDQLIIGSDSIMQDANGKFLEKPKDRADAEQMIRNRSGKKECIVSGLAMVLGEKVFQGYETTTLHWGSFSEEDIQILLQSDEWEGKCGGVMVEGVSGLFLKKIEGSLVNIMGFSLAQFCKGLGALGVNLDR